ncbi:MAG: TetR/AcrR family transcriptional regulator [Pyrinomonadaceae bacterium]
MARPLEFDKNIAMESAMDVFWEKGFESASLQDLIEAMDLSKSSFYQAFKSKHALYSETLGHYTDCMVDALSRNLEATSSGLKFIEHAFADVAEQAPLKSSQRGCFLMNTATEFAQKNNEIARLTKTGLKRIEAVFERAIEKAQRDGEISRSRDARSLANFLICNMSGLKTMVKAGLDRAVLRDVVKTIIASLK